MGNKLIEFVKNDSDKLNRGIKFFCLLIILELILIPIMCICKRYNFYILEDQVLYIFSTLSQVISTMFSVTIAGIAILYTNTQTKAAKSTHYKALMEIVNKRNKWYIILISIGAFLSIIFCVITLIIFRLNGIEDLIVISMNYGIYFSITEIGLIIFFTFILVSPYFDKKPFYFALKKELEYNKTTNGKAITEYNKIEGIKENPSDYDIKITKARYMNKYRILKKSIERFCEINKIELYKMFDFYEENMMSIIFRLVEERVIGSDEAKLLLNLDRIDYFLNSVYLIDPQYCNQINCCIYQISIFQKKFST